MTTDIYAVKLDDVSGQHIENRIPHPPLVPECHVLINDSFLSKMSVKLDSNGARRFTFILALSAPINIGIEPKLYKAL